MRTGLGIIDGYYISVPSSDRLRDTSRVTPGKVWDMSSISFILRRHRRWLTRDSVLLMVISERIQYRRNELDALLRRFEERNHRHGPKWTM